MINIEDIKVGKKYGFDIRQSGNRHDYYVEATCIEIEDVNGEFFIHYEDQGREVAAFSFSNLLRLVGPFNDEE